MFLHCPKNHLDLHPLRHLGLGSGEAAASVFVIRWDATDRDQQSHGRHLGGFIGISLGNFGSVWYSLIIWLPGAQTCRIWYEYYLIYLFMTFTIQTIRLFAMMIWCLYGALAAYMMDMITFFYDISQCFIHIISIWFLESVVRSQTYSQLYSKLHTMG